MSRAAAVGLAAWALGAACRPELPPPVEVPAGAAPAPLAAERLETDPPPFSEGIFPCSECHKDMETNPKRRVLTDEHTKIVLRHDEQHRWCLDCHSAADRDKLHLASGELIPFTESYRLCGQCHGDKYRDWRAGIHGRRRGAWNGEKRFLLCANCHNPHQPRFVLASQPPGKSVCPGEDRDGARPCPPPLRPSPPGEVSHVE